ncbi:MAG: hypothetical protein AAFP82_17290, partial [Bacteroidota bacterium]
MKTPSIYLGCLFLLFAFTQCETTESSEEKPERKPKIEREVIDIGVARFKSVKLEEGRHKSGLNQVRDRNKMTYTWTTLSKADTYLFQLFKNGQAFKTIRTQEPQVTFEMSELRGFRRGDKFEAKVSSIYGRGKPLFTRTYAATNLATGGQRMKEEEVPNQNPKEIQYEWQEITNADNYRFTLAIQSLGSEEMVEIVDTILSETNFSFVLEHLTRGDLIHTSVEPLQGDISLQTPEVSVAQYANGIARHDIVLLAMAGSTITRNSLDEMLAGASCQMPTKMTFEEGNYTTAQ